MKNKIMPTAVLSAICLIAALLLAAINLVTEPKILAAQQAEANKALIEVLPGGEGFTEVDIKDLGLPEAVKAAYTEKNGGCVFKLEVTGYKPGLVIMCGIDAQGKIAGVKHIASQETYGLEGELNGAYVGKSSADVSKIIATGATPNSLTSNAYYNAISAALSAYAAISANGGN